MVPVCSRGYDYHFLVLSHWDTASCLVTKSGNGFCIELLCYMWSIRQGSVNYQFEYFVLNWPRIAPWTSKTRSECSTMRLPLQVLLAGKVMHCFWLIYACRAVCLICKHKITVNLLPQLFNCLFNTIKGISGQWLYVTYHTAIHWYDHTQPGHILLIWANSFLPSSAGNQIKYGRLPISLSN